jgi:hypothetical protein
MTPKEKAIILVNRFYNSMEFSTPKRFAKQCALIAVQEIICSNPHSNPLNTDFTSTMKWWIDVQEELEKI